MHRARPIILDRNIKYKEVSDMNNNEEECDDDEGEQGYKRVTAVPVMLLSDAKNNQLSDSDGDDEEYCCWKQRLLWNINKIKMHCLVTC